MAEEARMQPLFEVAWAVFFKIATHGPCSSALLTLSSRPSEARAGTHVWNAAGSRIGALNAPSGMTTRQ
jgi:hypothetical protein